MMFFFQCQVQSLGKGAIPVFLYTSQSQATQEVWLAASAACGTLSYERPFATVGLPPVRCTLPNCNCWLCSLYLLLKSAISHHNFDPSNHNVYCLNHHFYWQVITISDWSRRTIFIPKINSSSS